MDSFARNITGFPLGILSAITVTAFLFGTMPLLTKLQILSHRTPATASVLVDVHRPAPPSPETRETPKSQSLPEKKMTETKEQSRQQRPKIDFLDGVSITAGVVGIDMGIDAVFPDTIVLPEAAYTLEEVDQPPRPLRSFPPQYPYLARRDNVEGWVALRFVVGTDGKPRTIEVAASDPVGVFEEAALESVARYSFKPAVKNGQSVNCIVKQKIQFSLD